MKKYGRWIIFGVVAVGIIALLLLVGINGNLRRKLEILLLELQIKTKVANIKEKAAATKAKAEANEISAVEIEKEAKATEEAISKQKEALQKGLEKRGLNADEIADRLGNLGV